MVFLFNPLWFGYCPDLCDDPLNIEEITKKIIFSLDNNASIEYFNKIIGKGYFIQPHIVSSEHQNQSYKLKEQCKLPYFQNKIAMRRK